MNLIESRMIPQGKTHDCFHGATLFWMIMMICSWYSSLHLSPSLQVQNFCGGTRICPIATQHHNLRWKQPASSWSSCDWLHFRVTGDLFWPWRPWHARAFRAFLIQGKRQGHRCGSCPGNGPGRCRAERRYADGNEQKIEQQWTKFFHHYFNRILLFDQFWGLHGVTVCTYDLWRRNMQR